MDGGSGGGIVSGDERRVCVVVMRQGVVTVMLGVVL